MFAQLARDDTSRKLRMCEVNYGNSPVFARDTSKDKQAPFASTTNASHNDTLQARSAEGQLICSAHDKKLAYDFAVRPPRTKYGQRLKPGVPTIENQFRIRGLSHCDSNPILNCGRHSIRMKEDWRRLTTIRATPPAGLSCTPCRTALLARHNSIEMINARLKIGHKLALAGPARTRVRSKDGHIGADPDRTDVDDRRRTR